MKPEEILAYINQMLDGRASTIISYDNEIKDYDHEIVKKLRDSHREELDQIQSIKRYLKEVFRC